MIQIGLIYNIGSNTELDNYSVARDILCLVKGIDTNNKEKAEELLKDHVRWVGDRPFNDMRYPLDNSRLEELGWKEKVTWEEGLKRTYDWYKENYANWSSWREALVAHPRRGLLQQEVRDGLPESNTEDDQ
jgi:dTDP-D-glucose 4,6-dehydratase